VKYIYFDESVVEAAAIHRMLRWVDVSYSVGEEGAKNFSEWGGPPFFHAERKAKRGLS